MLLQLTRSKQSYTIALLPILAIILWFKQISNPGLASLPLSTTPVALWINNGLGGSFWYVFIFLVLLLGSAFYLNFLNTKHIFIPERSYLPGIVFVIIASIVNVVNIPLFISINLILFSLDRMIATYKVEHLLYNAFDASLIIALASLFYLPSIFLIFFIWVCNLSLRPFIWREWVYTILGLSLPFLFIWMGYFFADKDFKVFILKLLANFEGKEVIVVSKQMWVYFMVIGFLIIISSQRLIRLFPTMKIISRKAFNLFLFFFLLSLVIPLFIKNGSLDFWMITCIPCAYLFSVFFMTVKKGWWGDLLFWFLLISVILDIYFL